MLCCVVTLEWEHMVLIVRGLKMRNRTCYNRGGHTAHTGVNGQGVSVRLKLSVEDSGLHG